MANERQMVVFEADEQAKITKMIKELHPDSTLIAFNNISNIIKKATGKLPKTVIPIVQQLCNSYSKTTITIKLGFADSCAVLSKFVIKSYCVMQRGMNKDDRKVLIALEKQLNTNIINNLDAFVESSRSELVQIHSELLREAVGAGIAKLLKKKDELESDLLRRLEELTNKASECGTNQGKIESLLFEKQSFEKALANSMGTKEETTAEIVRLKGQILDYEDKVQQHRDTCSEERGSLWIFSWKVRDVHIDNGERIARENLNRLIGRIRDLEQIVHNWSDIDLGQRISDIAAELTIYDAKKIQLENDYMLLKNLYDQVEKNFYATIEEIDKISRSTGTIDVESMKMVDELCLAVQSGQESIVSAYGKMRTHLQVIDVDEDFLVSSVLDALQLINMTDAYMGTTKIQNIKQVLALE
ncbi:unnamed protein product [Rotaria sp. Silwood2]|nr:unnamed protein product [Rotaria sp. Silwood2]CAF4629663.1 unnamed protein product [Rotaria sp. Silwood2]